LPVAKEIMAILYGFNGLKRGDHQRYFELIGFGLPWEVAGYRWEPTLGPAAGKPLGFASTHLQTIIRKLHAYVVLSSTMGSPEQFITNLNQYSQQYNLIIQPNLMSWARSKTAREMWQQGHQTNPRTASQ
jgi:hypothetical protein